MVAILQSREVKGLLNLSEILNQLHYCFGRRMRCLIPGCSETYDSYVYVNKNRVIIGSDYSLLPVCRQAISRTKVLLLLIRPLVAKLCHLNQNGSCLFPWNAFQKSATKYRPYMQTFICERTRITMYIYIYEQPLLSYSMINYYSRQLSNCRLYNIFRLYISN